MKPDDAVRVMHPSGAIWDAFIVKKGSLNTWWINSSAGCSAGECCVPESWLTLLSPPVAVGTLVEGRLRMSNSNTVCIGYYNGMTSAGRHAVATLRDEIGKPEMGMWVDHVCPLAVRARKWENLTEEERYEWGHSKLHDVYDHAYHLICGGSDYLVVEEETS